MSKLKDMRIKKGLSQREVEVALGLTNSTVSKWEKGIVKPRLELLPKIAELYGVSIDEIIQDYENK